MKALVALFALVCFLMVVVSFVTQKPSEVPEGAYSVRTNWFGTSYDTEAEPVNQHWIKPIQGEYREAWESR